MVDETIHFKDPIIEDLSLSSNPFLRFFHACLPYYFLNLFCRSGPSKFYNNPEITRRALHKADESYLKS